MKNILKYTACALALSAAFSCSKLNETPRFSCNASFAAFDQSAVIVDENVGKISLPVSIASIDPVGVTVAYEVVDGTATAGKNFKLVNEAATVVFDGNARSNVIEIDIVDLAGEFTGDLTFSVNLVSAGDIDLGHNKTCTVTIADLDHPLSDILGTYSVVGESYFNGPAQWTAEFTKDATDLSKVWMRGLAPAFASGSHLIYGTVSEDHNTITIPLGQVLPYNSTYNAHFYGFDGSYIYDETDMPSITLTRAKAGDPFVAVEYGWSFYAIYISSGEGAGNFDIIVPGVSFTKN
ncbi:MAG: hypothetical protein IJE11_02465 [Bacteroidales bacterium]|nr:hypothetical protein [Bacteroidales bacterium]